MADKPEPIWVAPFLAALAETGNVTWSATQAAVDFTTIYRRRKRYPDFAAAWAKALEKREAEHRARIVPPAMPGRRGTPAPPQDLIERSCSRNGPQLVRIGAGRWSKRAQGDFLAELAACANVRRAAAAAGFSPTAMYRRRLQDQHFAEAWDAAGPARRTGTTPTMKRPSPRRATISSPASSGFARIRIGKKWTPAGRGMATIGCRPALCR